jgi:hypothetical protein
MLLQGVLWKRVFEELRFVQVPYRGAKWQMQLRALVIRGTKWYGSLQRNVYSNPMLGESR